MSNYLKAIIFLSLGLLAVFGWHFGTVFGFFGTAPQTQSDFFIRLGFIIVAFLLSSVVTGIMMAKHDDDALTPDEREEKITLKADRVGSAVVYLGLLVVMWLVFLPMTPMQTANAILAVVYLSELIKIGYGLFILKRPFS